MVSLKKSMQNPHFLHDIFFKCRVQLFQKHVAHIKWSKVISLTAIMKQSLRSTEIRDEERIVIMHCVQKNEMYLVFSVLMSRWGSLLTPDIWLDDSSSLCIWESAAWLFFGTISCGSVHLQPAVNRKATTGRCRQSSLLSEALKRKKKGNKWVNKLLSSATVVANL